MWTNTEGGLGPVDPPHLHHSEHSNTQPTHILSWVGLQPTHTLSHPGVDGSPTRPRPPPPWGGWVTSPPTSTPPYGGGVTSPPAPTPALWWAGHQPAHTQTYPRVGGSPANAHPPPPWGGQVTWGLLYTRGGPTGCQPTWSVSAEPLASVMLQAHPPSAPRESIKSDN